MWVVAALYLASLRLMGCGAVNEAGDEAEYVSRFVVTFMAFNRSCSPRLLVLSQQESDVTINVTVRMPLMPLFKEVSSSITDSRMTSILLPPEARVQSGRIENKGFELTATGDVSVYALDSGLDDLGDLADGPRFHVIPTRLLGSHYVLASATIGDASSHQLGITATRNATDVNVTLPATAKDADADSGADSDPDQQVGLLTWRGQMYRGGDTVHVRLDAFQSVTLVSRSDLTGTSITSSYDVSVYSGALPIGGSWTTAANRENEKETDNSDDNDDGEANNNNHRRSELSNRTKMITTNHTVLMSSRANLTDPTNIRNGSTCVRQVVEQFPPSRSWGTRYFTVPLTEATGDTISIVAGQEATTVWVSTVAGSQPFNVSAFGHVKVGVSASDYMAISAQRPILVLQYLGNVLKHSHTSVDDDDDDDGDDVTSTRTPPLFHIVASASQWRNRYHVQCSSDASSYRSQRLAVVIQSSHINGLLADGVHIHNDLSTPLGVRRYPFNVTRTPVVMWNANHTVLRFSKGTCVHQLSHTSRTINFGVITGYPISDYVTKLLPHVAKHVDDVSQTTSGGDTATEEYSVQPSVFSATRKFDKEDRNKSDVVKFQVVPDDGKSSKVIYFNEAGAEAQPGDADSSVDARVIAVILSLGVAVVFVIVCLVGFTMTETLCRKDYFSSARVSPYVG